MVVIQWNKMIVQIQPTLTGKCFQFCFFWLYTIHVYCVREIGCADVLLTMCSVSADEIVRFYYCLLYMRLIERK